MKTSAKHFGLAVGH